jgi:hypothetical protein
MSRYGRAVLEDLVDGPERRQRHPDSEVALPSCMDFAERADTESRVSGDVTDPLADQVVASTAVSMSLETTFGRMTIER